MNHVQFRLPLALAAAAIFGVATLGGAAPVQADPPGNNGTVKVAPHGEVDGIPQNTPHPGCVFDVEWYGFDEGEEIVSEVALEAWRPTAVPMTVEGPTEVFVGGDPATGAGTDTDAESADEEPAEEESTEEESTEGEPAEEESTEGEPAEEEPTGDGSDGEASYTLAFDGEPHPQQGYHVRLTIHTPGSQGADVKHAVFWVQECAPEEAEGEQAPGQPEVTGPPAAPEQAEVAGEQAEEPQMSTQVEVFGEQEVAPQPAAGQTVERAVAPTAVEAGLPGATLAAATSHLGALLALAGALVLGAALLLRRARG